MAVPGSPGVGWSAVAVLTLASLPLDSVPSVLVAGRSKSFYEQRRVMSVGVIPRSMLTGVNAVWRTLLVHATPLFVAGWITQGFLQVGRVTDIYQVVPSTPLLHEYIDPRFFRPSVRNLYLTYVKPLKSSFGHFPGPCGVFLARRYVGLRVVVADEWELGTAALVMVSEVCQQSIVYPSSLTSMVVRAWSIYPAIMRTTTPANMAYLRGDLFIRLNICRSCLCPASLTLIPILKRWPAVKPCRRSSRV